MHSHASLKYTVETLLLLRAYSFPFEVELQGHKDNQENQSIPVVRQTNRLGYTTGTQEIKKSM